MDQDSGFVVAQAAVPQVYVNAKQYHCIMRRRAKRAAAAAKNQQLLQRKVRDCLCLHRVLCTCMDTLHGQLQMVPPAWTVADSAQQARLPADTL